MWVLGKEGWYLAAVLWDSKIALHWQKMGYKVEHSNPILKKFIKGNKKIN